MAETILDKRFRTLAIEREGIQIGTICTREFAVCIAAFRNPKRDYFDIFREKTRRGVILSAAFEITRLSRAPRARARFTGSMTEFNLDLLGFARGRVKGAEFRNSARREREKD